MRLTRIAMAVGLAALGLARPASAQTATQTVTFEVQAINQISVSGNPSTLSVNTATAGSAPTSASNNSTTWAITTNELSKKVTAAINSNMPTGVTLSVNLAAPTGASSSTVSLSTVAGDAVTGISQLNQGSLIITYTLAATTTAGTVASTSRTVTFTVM